MKKFLLLLTSLVSAITMSADVVEFTQFNSVDQTIEPVSFIAEKAKSSNAPLAKNAHFRLYYKNTLTVSVTEGYYLESIVFSTESSNGSFLEGASTNVGTFDSATKTWECASGDQTTKSVTLTNGTVTSGQTRINKITVTYGVGGSSKTKVDLSWSPNEGTVNLGEKFTAPILSAKVDGIDNTEAMAAIIYASNNEELLQVSTDGTMTLTPDKTGTAIITASIPNENELYYGNNAKYTLTVVDPNNPSEQIVFANKGYANGAEISTVTQGDVTLTFDKGSNTTAPKYYTSSEDVRLYGGGSLTISVPAEYVLTRVISTYKNTKNTLTSNNGEFNSDYTIWTAGTTTKNTVVFTEDGTSGNRSWTKIEVYYTKAADPTKGDVTLTFDGGDMTENFEAGKTVQGRVATADVEGLEISYSSSDETVATVDASGMLTLVGPGTTTITAQTAETTEYNAGRASYTLTVDIVYNNIADVLKYAKNNDVIDLNFAMTVGHVNGKNVFVTDNMGGYILIYGQTEYTANDVIPAGMSAKYTIYNGLPEFVPQTLPAATEKGTYEIETVAATEVFNQPLNKIIMVENVTFADATPAKGEFTGVSGETNLDFYNQMKLESVEAGNYDVLASVGTYKSGTEIRSQLLPLEYYALPGVATATIGDKEIVESFELQGTEVTVVLTAPKGESIWYKFTAATSTEAAQAAEAGFTEYPAEGIKIGKQGTLEYYTELNGRMSEVTTITFTGTPASISEIIADDAAAEWYDLSGRRVAAPGKGVYIKKTGSKVSKIVF